MKKNLSEYLNLNGQDINISSTYERGENNVHPYFNIFIQWKGMEIYPNRLLNIKNTSLSDNMIFNYIVIKALYVEDIVQTYMEKEGLGQVGDWFDDPNVLMNPNDIVETEIDLGSSRKRKRISIQQMQTLLIPSIRDRTVCTKPQMDFFSLNKPELYIEYVNNHAKMINFLHVTNDSVRKQQVERANSNFHHATAAAWVEFINVQEVGVTSFVHSVYIYLHYVIYNIT